MRNIFSLLIITIITSFGFSQNGEVISEENGVTVLKVWGTHAERGFAQGYFLADEIVDIWSNYFNGIYYEYNYDEAKAIISNTDNFTIPTEYIIEAQNVLLGMTAAGWDMSAADEWDLILMSTFLDIDGILASSKSINGINGLGCSTYISWNNATSGTSLDGKSVATRHTDFGAGNGLIGNDVIVIHIPSETDEQPWVNVGYAGMIAPLSAMNQGGLGVFSQSLNQTADLGYGVAGQNYEPYWFTIRKGIEKRDYNNDGYNNVLDIKDAVLSYTNGYAIPFIFTSVAKSTSNDSSLIAMIGEISPNAPITTFRTTNFDDAIPGDNIYSANQQIARNNHLDFCARYNSMIDNVGTGTGYDAQSHWDFTKEYSNSNTILVGVDNIQLMQYIPEEQILTYAGYTPPSTQAYLSPTLTIDLDTIFPVYTSSQTNKINNNELSLYPNPSNDFLNIKTDNILKVNLINMNGNIIKSYKFNNSNFEKINITYLNKGMYIIDINTNSETYKKLFVKE